MGAAWYASLALARQAGEEETEAALASTVSQSICNFLLSELLLLLFLQSAAATASS